MVKVTCIFVSFLYSLAFAQVQKCTDNLEVYAKFVETANDKEVNEFSLVAMKMTKGASNYGEIYINKGKSKVTHLEYGFTNLKGLQEKKLVTLSLKTSKEEEGFYKLEKFIFKDFLKNVRFPSVLDYTFKNGSKSVCLIKQELIDFTPNYDYGND